MKHTKTFLTPLILMFLISISVFSQNKPNIVLINMDNFGYGELGCYGGGILRGAATPRIDKLASEGMKLLNFNVEAQCTPSRASLMTGRYPVRSGNMTVPLETNGKKQCQKCYPMLDMLQECLESGI